MPKTWLITGSSRGFGRELVKAVLEGEAGDSVVATARRPEQLGELVQQYGDRVRAVALDVTNAVAAHAAVERAVDVFGSLDVVVNNAGYANSAPIEDTSDEDFRAQIETNLFGVVNVSKAAVPVLRAQGSGHFVQFSSIGGRVGGSPGLAAYQTAKFGVEGFSEVLRSEMEPFGVKVTIVEPGAFRTEWGGASMERRETSEAYAGTVGAMNDFRLSTVCQWPGDPARAARVIEGIVRLEEPPRRLLLGSDAVRMAGEADRARIAETEEWADLSSSTDFPAGADTA